LASISEAGVYDTGHYAYVGSDNDLVEFRWLVFRARPRQAPGTFSRPRNVSAWHRNAEDVPSLHRRGINPTDTRRRRPDRPGLELPIAPITIRQRE
jgi:hypothetical protein